MCGAALVEALGQSGRRSRTTTQSLRVNANLPGAGNEIAGTASRRNECGPRGVRGGSLKLFYLKRSAAAVSTG